MAHLQDLGVEGKTVLKWNYRNKVRGCRPVVDRL
jgi:hypothetical protein